VAEAGFGVLPGGDVADDTAVVIGDKDARGLALDIDIDVAGLAPAPIVTVDRSEGGFHTLVDGNAREGLDGDPFQVGQVGGLIGSNVHADFWVLDFRFWILPAPTWLLDQIGIENPKSKVPEFPAQLAFGRVIRYTYEPLRAGRRGSRAAPAL
jgi:hypothetical protein